MRIIRHFDCLAIRGQVKHQKLLSMIEYHLQRELGKLHMHKRVVDI